MGRKVAKASPAEWFPEPATAQRGEIARKFLELGEQNATVRKFWEQLPTQWALVVLYVLSNSSAPAIRIICHPTQ
jgi:hypothetical protein